MGWVRVILAGHDHEHSIAKLNINQARREKYFFAFIRKIMHFIVSEDENFGCATIDKNEHPVPFVWGMTDWPYLSNNGEPSESLVLACILNIIEILLAVNGIKLKNPILIDVLLKKD